ncbi:hypothetical protein BKA93DRAFT_471764 [Sparassis latifolia]
MTRSSVSALLHWLGGSVRTLSTYARIRTSVDHGGEYWESEHQKKRVKRQNTGECRGQTAKSWTELEEGDSVIQSPLPLTLLPRSAMHTLPVPAARDTSVEHSGHA